MRPFPENRWIEDLQGEVDVAALTQYVHLWDILSRVELNESIPDKHVWCHGQPTGCLGRRADTSAQLSL